MATVAKRTLSPGRKRLIELMQEINYGRIENLQIRGGEPVFDPPPTVLRHFLFGKENGQNPCRANDDFALKKKVTEMFEIFDREQWLFVRELIIDDGLPLRMTAVDTTNGIMGLH